MRLIYKSSCLSTARQNSAIIDDEWSQPSSTVCLSNEIDENRYGRIGLNIHFIIRLCGILDFVCKTLHAKSFPIEIENVPKRCDLISSRLTQYFIQLFSGDWMFFCRFIYIYVFECISLGEKCESCIKITVDAEKKFLFIYRLPHGVLKGLFQRKLLLGIFFKTLLCFDLFCGRVLCRENLTTFLI